MKKSALGFQKDEYVLVYGGASKSQAFFNGVPMFVEEFQTEAHANWIRCKEYDVNEKKIRSYWFLEQQLRKVEMTAKDVDDMIEHYRKFRRSFK